MAMITVRNLSDSTHAKLKRRAAAHGRSMEAEVRAILDRTPEQDPTPPFDLVASIRDHFAGADLSGFEIPDRQQYQGPIDFGDVEVDG